MHVHDICELFPLMSKEEFSDLLTDIVKNGLREPIWLYEGKILDGRNRYRACRTVGIEPETREYVGSDPLGFVISLNLKRRHLSESQRAMIATEIANLKPWGQETSGVADASTDACDASIEASQAKSYMTQSEAAERLKVSRTSVQKAKKVREKASPSLREAVNRGDVKVSAAADIADLPGPEQEAAVIAGTVAEKAKEVRAAKREKASTPDHAGVCPLCGSRIGGDS